MALVYKNGTYYDNTTGQVYKKDNLPANTWVVHPGYEEGGYMTPTQNTTPAAATQSVVSPSTPTADYYQNTAQNTLNGGTTATVPTQPAYNTTNPALPVGVTPTTPVLNPAVPDASYTSYNAPPVSQPSAPATSEPLTGIHPDTGLPMSFADASEFSRWAANYTAPTTAATATPVSNPVNMGNPSFENGIDPGVTDTSTPTTNVTPAEEYPYGDMLAQILAALASVSQQDVEGTTEDFLPSSSTSELTQALQNKAMELLNQQYGYTPEEEALIWQTQMANFNRSQEQDLARLQNLYEQYGWRTGAPELGSQAQGSLQQYYGDRALAESNLASTMAQTLAEKRASDQTQALSTAMGINDQIYGQQRGDFADMITLMQQDQSAQGQQFNQLMETMQFMSDQEQQDFLNQQGISDRESQDYFQALAAQWGMTTDAANIENQELAQWTDYLSGTELNASDYLESLNWLNNFSTNIYSQGINAMTDQVNALAPFVTALATLLAGGDSTNVNVTTPDVNVEGDTSSFNLGDLFNGLSLPDTNIDLSGLLDNLNLPDTSIDLSGLLSGLNLPNVDLSGLTNGIDLSKLGLPAGASITIGGKTYSVGQNGAVTETPSTTTGNTNTDTGVNEGEPTSGNDTTIDAGSAATAATTGYAAAPVWAQALANGVSAYVISQVAGDVLSSRGWDFWNSDKKNELTTSDYPYAMWNSFKNNNPKDALRYIPKGNDTQSVLERVSMFAALKEGKLKVGGKTLAPVVLDSEERAELSRQGWLAAWDGASSQSVQDYITAQANRESGVTTQTNNTTDSETNNTTPEWLEQLVDTITTAGNTGTNIPDWLQTIIDLSMQNAG